MHVKRVLSAAVILVLCTFAWTADRAVLVHNTLEEINACKGKLKLKPVRVWGGDEEQDEKKLFKMPTYLAVDEKKNVYISDSESHYIRVFDRDGNYLRTIGGKGQGPGDTYGPHRLAFTPEGDLVVNEGGAHRLQYFSPAGKSKKIIKTRQYVRWFAFTSKNQLVVHMFKRTFDTRTLVSIVDEKLNPVKDIGVYHDTEENYMDAEGLHFTMDGDDNIIVTNGYTPVIRKYNLDGEMTLVITYDTSVKLPVEVTMNQKGDEIEIKRRDNWKAPTHKVKRSGDGVVIQRVQSRGFIGALGRGIGVDAENRIYLVTLKRERTLEELQKTPNYLENLNSFKKTEPAQTYTPETAHLKILVFSPQGKVIAEAPVTDQLDGFIVSGDRLYITDPLFYKQILEYEITIE